MSLHLCHQGERVLLWLRLRRGDGGQQDVGESEPLEEETPLLLRVLRVFRRQRPAAGS